MKIAELGDRGKQSNSADGQNVCSEGKRESGMTPTLWSRTCWWMMAFPLTKANIQCLSQEV